MACLNLVDYISRARRHSIKANDRTTIKICATEHKTLNAYAKCVKLNVTIERIVLDVIILNVTMLPIVMLYRHS